MSIKCKWVEDSDGNFNTDCGNIFCLIDGTPDDNDMVYCCYCGQPLLEVLFKEGDA